MRKILLFILCVTSLASCSGGIEKESKLCLDNLISEMKKRNDVLHISDVNTILNNDSICVIQFTAKENEVETRVEYYYVKQTRENDIIFSEGFRTIDGSNKSIIDMAKYKSNGFELNDMAYKIAASFCDDNGRVVKKEYKLK